MKCLDKGTCILFPFLIQNEIWGGGRYKDGRPHVGLRRDAGGGGWQVADILVHAT